MNKYCFKDLKFFIKILLTFIDFFKAKLYTEFELDNFKEEKR